MSQRNILAFFKPKNAAQTQPENATDGNQRSRGKDDHVEEEEKHERTDGGSCVHRNQCLGETASTTRTRTTMRDRTEDGGALECDLELGDQEAVGKTPNIDYHDESGLIKRRKRNCGEAVAAGLESFALPSDRRRSDTSAGGETVATYETGSQSQRLHDVGSPEDGTPSRAEQRHEDMDEFGFISGASTSEVKLTPLESQILSLKKRYQKHRGKATTDVGDIEDIDVLFIEVGYKYAAFGHDAYIVSPLGLACFRDRATMKTSCPTHKVSSYTRRLCNQGLKVGIVRQLKREEADNYRDAIDGFIAGCRRKDPFLRCLVGVYTASTVETNMRKLLDSDSAVTATVTATVTTDDAPKPKYNPFLRRFVYPKEKVDNSAMDAELHGELDLNVSAYIMCVAQGTSDEIGVALLEASTGDAIYDHFADDHLRSRLFSICKAQQPVEIMLCSIRDFEDECTAKTKAALTAHVADVLENTGRHVRFTNVRRAVDEGVASEVLTSFFGHEDWLSESRLPALVIIAIAKTLKYFEAFGLANAMSAFRRARKFDACGRCLKINSNAIQQLELIDSSDNATNKDGGHRCLLSLFSHTVTKGGSRLLRQWILHPLLETREINDRLDGVEYMVNARNGGRESSYPTDYSRPLKSLRKVDLDRSLERIRNRRVGPAEFVHVLEIIGEVSSKYAELFPAGTEATSPEIPNVLRSCLQQVASADLRTEINRLMSRIHAASGRKSNLVQMFLRGSDRAEGSEPVREAKRAFDGVKAKLEDHLNVLASQLQCQNVKGAPKTLEYKHMTEKEYLIELKATVKSVPADWAVVNSTKSATRYRPRSVDALYNELLKRQHEMDAAARDCFQRLLLDMAGADGENGSGTGSLLMRLRDAAAALSKLDALASIATASSSAGYTRPMLIQTADEGSGKIDIDIVGGRHPIVETTTFHDFVANDCQLSNAASGDDPPQLILITGANMAGKSVYIKQTALLVIMAQMGSFVPAERFRMASNDSTLIDAVYTRIGASDRLSVGSSTFMEELSETSAILRESTAKSLVVIDELGRGTSTFDGTALAHATMRFLVSRSVPTLFVTHYHSLGELAQELTGVKSSYMSYLQTGAHRDRLTFLYKMVPGLSPASFGINVAALAGLDESIQKNAAEKSREMANKTAVNVPLLLKELVGATHENNITRLLKLHATIDVSGQGDLHM